MDKDTITRIDTLLTTIQSIIDDAVLDTGKIKFMQLLILRLENLRLLEIHYPILKGSEPCIELDAFTAWVNSYYDLGASYRNRTVFMVTTAQLYYLLVGLPRDLNSACIIINIIANFKIDGVVLAEWTPISVESLDNLIKTDLNNEVLLKIKYIIIHQLYRDIHPS